MIFSTIQEITSLYPTSKWNKVETLLPMLTDEEYTTLTPFLGEELHAFMQEEYARLIADYSLAKEGLAGMAAAGDVTDEDRRTAELLRHMQSVTFYSLMSHNRNALSNSLNAGGGFNRMSAADYDPSATQELHDLDREFFSNLHRKIDLMLRALEADALRKKPLWRDKWQHSSYFYLKSDLIFTRAEILNEYHNIENSREKFIKLVPDIRFIQQTQIEPRIGQALFSSLVRSMTDPQVIDALVRRAKRIMNPKEEETLPPTDYELGECFEQAKYALHLLRMSCAQFVKWRTEKDKRIDTKTDGDLCLSQAESFIKSCSWLNPQPPAEEFPDAPHPPHCHTHEHHRAHRERKEENGTIFRFGSSRVTK